MSFSIKEILAMFFFGYWIVKDSKPFSIWILIAIYFGVYIFEMIITSILKKSEKTIKEKSVEIDNFVKDTDKRLKKLEEKGK
jgi:pilus assembly protein TadC